MDPSDQAPHGLFGYSVLLVEDDDDFASVHQQWLSTAGACVSRVNNTGLAREHLRRGAFQLDVAVISVCSIHSDEYLLARQIKVSAPACALLLQGEFDSLPLIQQSKRLGAAFLRRSAEMREFLAAVRRLVAQELPDISTLTAIARRRWLLSPQQTRVLYYNLWSCSNEEIASALGVSVHTVQDYQQELRRKTGARTKDGYLRRILECAGTEPPRCGAQGEVVKLASRPN